MAYAAETTVTVERSIAEIVGMVKKAGAQRVAQYEEPTGFSIAFALAERQVRFRVALPTIAEMPTHDGRHRHLDAAARRKRMEQAHRQRARALMLVIKAKLESVDSGVETFEQAFLPNIVMANGETVYDRIEAPIRREYETGAGGPLLLAGPAS